MLRTIKSVAEEILNRFIRFGSVKSEWWFVAALCFIKRIGFLLSRPRFVSAVLWRESISIEENFYYIPCIFLYTHGIYKFEGCVRIRLEF